MTGGWETVYDRKVLIVALMSRVVLSRDLKAPLESFRIGNNTFENTGLAHLQAFTIGLVAKVAG